MDSQLPDSWTAISANDMLIGDRTAGNTSVNYSPDNGPIRHDYIQAKKDYTHHLYTIKEKTTRKVSPKPAERGQQPTKQE